MIAPPDPSPRRCWACDGILIRRPTPILIAGDRPDDPTPRDGDIGLCPTCAMPFVFERNVLRKPTDPEMREILDDPEYEKAADIILRGVMKGRIRPH